MLIIIPDGIRKLNYVVDIEQQNQTCDSECTDKGCWGPGPDMCVSCRHFSRRGHCVAFCNLLYGWEWISQSERSFLRLSRSLWPTMSLLSAVNPGKPRWTAAAWCVTHSVNCKQAFQPAADWLVQSFAPNLLHTFENVNVSPIILSYKGL